MLRLNWTNVEANPEHLTFLIQGVDVWNHWRHMNLQIIPSLHKANLSKANLNHANFNKAQFKEANLSGANLKGSAFGNAILIKANLSNADLSGVNFYDADLSEADLTGANLSCTHFNNTALNKSNFSRGVFFATRIADSNGSQVNFSNANFKSVDIQRTNFSDGIDWKAFLLSFQELQTEYDEDNLSVQAIEKKSGGMFVIRLEVSPEANKADIERQAKVLYEIELKGLYSICK